MRKRLNIKMFLDSLRDRWKRIAHAIGVFQTRLVLTIFYYTLLLPFALLVRLFLDPLALRPGGRKTNWQPRKTPSYALDDLRKQS